jgi:RTA1 like protein
MAWVSISCFLELLGYIGRLMMHVNPWSVAGFEIQICCLVLAPTFMAAGVYLTMKHIINFVGPEYSRIRPKLYPWIFICCDICSIVIQAIGGGVAASSGTSSNANQSVVNAGDDLIVAGIAFQVFTMTICGILAVNYYMRLRKADQQPSNSEKGTNDTLTRYGTNSKRDHQFHIYCSCIVSAYLAILIRCIYRIPEMAGGWGNPRMREEPTFLVLDGLMIAIAGTFLTVGHPGIMFPGWTKK